MSATLELSPVPNAWVAPGGLLAGNSLDALGYDTRHTDRHIDRRDSFLIDDEDERADQHEVPESRPLGMLACSVCCCGHTVSPLRESRTDQPGLTCYGKL